MKDWTDTYPYLSLAERDRRWEVLRGFLAERELDALLIFGTGRNAHDQYVSNEQLKATVLFTPADEPLLYCGRYPLDRFDGAGDRFERWVSGFRTGFSARALADDLGKRGLDRSRVGVVGLTSRAIGQSAGTVPYTMWTQVRAQVPDVTWVDVADEFETMTLFKSPEERDLVRKAAWIGEQACLAAIDAAAPGVPESVVMGQALRTIVALGGWIAPPLILERAGAAHFGWNVPERLGMGGRPYVLSSGDVIAFELFSFYGGFESQQQLTISIGEPTETVSRLARTAQDSYRCGLEALRPGDTFASLCEAMHVPLARDRVWNTGPLVQTVAPTIYNGAARIDCDADPLVAALPDPPRQSPRDGDFELAPGVSFAFEPSAVAEGRRVCVGGTVMLTETGVEELNEVTNQLVVVPG